jgi:hypothetical protein
MATLLEKAKELNKQSGQVVVSDEHVELALAFIKGEITMKSATEAMGYRKGASGAYITMTRALKLAYERHLITVDNSQNPTQSM